MLKDFKFLDLKNVHQFTDNQGKSSLLYGDHMSWSSSLPNLGHSYLSYILMCDLEMVNTVTTKISHPDVVSQTV